MNIDADATEVPENQIRWNSVIVQCDDLQSLKTVSDICGKKRVGYLMVGCNLIQQAMTGRGILQAGYKILTTVDNLSQKNPGSSKLMGIHADAFDADGFEIYPMKTDNPAMLLNDLRDCSSFLRDNLSQRITIGWNLSRHLLKESETLILLDMIAKGYRPDYIRFGESQGLFCVMAKRVCATKTVLPYGTNSESDLIAITTQDVIKLLKN